MTIRQVVAGANWAGANSIGVVSTLYRYWRVNILSTVGSGYISVPEIEFRAVSGGPDITTPSMTALAKDYLNSGFSPAKAFDNDPGSVCIQANSDDCPWWIGIDLGAGNENTVNEISWLPRSDAPTWSPASMEMQRSDDGITWVTAWSRSGISGYVAGTPKIITKP